MTTAVSAKYSLTLVKKHQNFNKCNDAKSFEENVFSLVFLHTKICSEKNPPKPKPLNA